MREDCKKPPAQPWFRPHRLVPVKVAVSEPEPTASFTAWQEMPPWPEAPDEPLSPQVAEAAQELADQAWLVFQKVAHMLKALSTLLDARSAPEEAGRALELTGLMLLALPNQLAAGVLASVPHVDTLFAWLINAPGHAGLIQYLLDWLTYLDGTSVGSKAFIDFATERETLRSLHRALVTMQKQWDGLVCDSFLDGYPQFPVCF